MAEEELKKLAVEYAQSTVPLTVDPEAVVAGFRFWLRGSFSASALKAMQTRNLRDMWEKLAHEYAVLEPLSEVMLRILAIAAAEAHAERVIGHLKRVLTALHFNTPMNAELLSRIRMLVDDELRAEVAGELDD
jgi:hypothetical protein